MLIALGNVQMNSLIDGIIAMAKDQTGVHELNTEKGLGSWTHHDGWGIAYLNGNKEWIIHRSTQAIYEDPQINHFRGLKTNLAILHVRKKMGSEKSINNTHPFIIRKDNPGEIIFCHNGFIDQEIHYDSSLVPQGQTDSEKLFYSLLTDLGKENFIIPVIRNNFQRYSKITGTNIIFASKEKSFVAQRENNFPTYYQMQLGINNNFLIIGSEKISQVPNLTWQPLEQGDIIEIENDSLKYFVHKLKPSPLP